MLSIDIPDVLALLRERGPRTGQEILDALQDNGEASVEELDDLLLDDAAALVANLPNERFAALDALLGGRIFTHRLTAEELERDALQLEPDLAPVGVLIGIDGFAELAGGAELDLVFDALGSDEDAAIQLPPGTLAAYAPGDLIGMRVTTAGFALEPVAQARRPMDGWAAVLDELVHDEDGDAWPQPVDASIWEMCSRYPDLFTDPVTPIGELLAEAGLDHSEGLLAPAGFDMDVWRVGLAVAAIADRHDLDEPGALAVFTMMGPMWATIAMLHAQGSPDEPAEPVAATDGVDPGGPPDPGTAQDNRELAEVLALAFGQLAEPAVAAALFEEARDTCSHGVEALGMLAEDWQAQAPRSARAALHWLRAGCYEDLGEILDAEGQLQAALDLDSSWPLAVYDLARFAADRGDTKRGLSLLHRLDVPHDDPLLTQLRTYDVPERTSLGRNDRCWCGSGRKYKQCHLGREVSPLEERAGWLYSKATDFVLRDSDFADEFADLAEIRNTHLTKPDAATQALVMDAVLFEGGAFEEFLATRGDLLPADEQLLGAQWLAIDRSLFEVEDVRPGDGVALRDLRTGDRHEVRERRASRQLRRGDRVCARVVPAGATMQFFGGIEPVPDWLVERALELLDTLADGDADAEELIEVLSARFAPPTLVTTDGQPMVACRAVLDAVGDPGQLRQRLDEVYEPDGDRRWVWHEATEGDGWRALGSLALDGRRLTAEAMNEQRFDTLLGDLAALGWRVTEQERTPMADKLREHRASGPAEIPEITDPDVLAALEDHVIGYEESWLDLEIPALGGSTPRQAADDPTRRGDLIRLLDTFDRGPAGPGAMNPGRIRAALGL